MPTSSDPILATDLVGLALRSPVILAAGTAGYVDEMSDALDLSRVGAVVTKSITLRAREGNATWRVVECRPPQAGMLNAIGLANVGVEHFVEHIAPRIAGAPCPVIGSIAGFSIDDYVRVAAEMDEIDALAGVELNVSCPNVHGGTEFGCDPGALAELVAAVRPVLSRKPMIVKLSPIAVGHPSIVEVARAVVRSDGATKRRSDGGGAGPKSQEPGLRTQHAARGTPYVLRPGADAIALANTIPAMAIDVRTRRPRLANVTGGLSGPAVHPIAVRLVHEVYRAVARDAGVALIGVGGVMTWQDAAEFILAGASAVEMGTALFVDPRSPLRVARGLVKWARSQGCARVSDLVGGLVHE